jgi:type IV secretory pathway protease TraF
LRILAETRGYLRPGAQLIKPIGAGVGGTVCRDGSLVTINGRAAARANPYARKRKLRHHDDFAQDQCPFQWVAPELP